MVNIGIVFHISIFYTKKDFFSNKNLPIFPLKCGKIVDNVGNDIHDNIDDVYDVADSVQNVIDDVSDLQIL